MPAPLPLLVAALAALPPTILGQQEAPSDTIPRGLSPEEMLGENFLASLILALGGALLLGTGLALIRPQVDGEGNEVRAPIGRSLIQMTVGGVASVWALATMLS